MTTPDKPLVPAAVAVVAVGESLFATQVELVRMAGYPMTGADDMFATRPPYELELLDLARDLHTALASLRLIERGKPVPGPDGADGKAYWTEQAEALWAGLVAHAREHNLLGGEQR